VATATLAVVEDGGTCEAPSKLAIPVTTDTTLVLCKSRDTSVRRGCNGKLDDGPVFVWGRFSQRAPTEIPAYQLKM
jgi:hypothetical protein